MCYNDSIRSLLMTYPNPHKARLSVDCTPEERKVIKMMAAREEKTISEFILSLVHEKFSHCIWDHHPNEETIKSIEMSEKGKGVSTFDNPDDLFKSLGI
ncbi:MAG: hypothetical protein KDK65_00870, partial [Chlamydiia bacterium]|nr:hypothetical protein [Chlamydiia bacterium]